MYQDTCEAPGRARVTSIFAPSQLTGATASAENQDQAWAVDSVDADGDNWPASRFRDSWFKAAYQVQRHELVVHGVQAVLLFSFLFHGGMAPPLTHTASSFFFSPLSPAVYGECSIETCSFRFLIS